MLTRPNVRIGYKGKESKMNGLENKRERKFGRDYKRRMIMYACMREIMIMYRVEVSG